jgi:hypothetical protein
MKRDGYRLPPFAAGSTSLSNAAQGSHRVKPGAALTTLSNETGLI